MTEKKSFLSKILNKIFIILFYLCIIAFFLYLPLIKNLFYTKESVINVYTFTDMISEESAKEFEEKTGIKVNLKYYDTNDELYAKFKISGGQGYDLITPSDYLVDLFRKNDLLHEIDVSKLKNFKQLDKRFIGHYFDPKNEYSVPYFWSVDGIIFDKKVLENYKVDWDLVFNKPESADFKICMLDSFRETIYLSSIYLFDRISNFSEEDLSKIKDLLIRQNKWVEVYLYASLQYYLISDVVPLAVTTSAFAKKIIELSDRFEFVVPEKGSILMIDSLAIPKKSKKVNIVHAFIDFLISKEVIFYNSNLYGYNPVNKKSYSLIPSKILNNKAFYPDDEVFKKFYVIDNSFDIKKLDNLWLEVKSS